MTIAVIDLETTGLFTQKYHRIVEIAVLRLDLDGSVREEWGTLVNPQRDIGARDVHGLSAGDLVEAPTFSDIAGDLLERLAGTVIAAHNARFDVSFLNAEFARLGLTLPTFPVLCTQELAGTYFGGRLRLKDCCAAFDITLSEAHSALGDARATAELLTSLFRIAREQGADPLAALQPKLDGTADAWPRLPASGRVLLRQEAVRRRESESHYLARLVDRLGAPARMAEGPGDVTKIASYLTLLDQALEDRLVAPEEADALLACALEWGLTAEQVRAAHQSYLDSLVRAAADDGVVTPVEKEDLVTVARLLGCDERSLDSQLARALEQRSNAEEELGATESLVGKTVCFTGELQCCLGGEPIDRVRAEILAQEAGLVVKSSVTKKLDLLVVADPHSMSGKAKKARTYGIRVMHEAVFWRKLGLRVV